MADSLDGLLSSIEAVQTQGQGGQLHEVILSQLTQSLEAMLTNHAFGELPQRTQLLTLAADTSHELRRFMEGEG